MRWTIAAAIILLSLPGGLAGGTLDAEVLYVDVRDQRESCSTPVAGFCSFDLKAGEGLGDFEIDIVQNVSYVGLATELPLLPDDSITLRGNDVVVMNPAPELLTNTWNQHAPELLSSEAAGVQLSQVKWVAYYQGPWVRDPAGEWRRNELGVEWANRDFYQVGPFNAQHEGQTDNLTSGIGGAPICGPADAETSCDEAEREVAAFWRSTTPNVRKGIQFWDFQVATDPEMLRPAAALTGPSYRAFLAISNESSPVASLRGSIGWTDLPGERAPPRSPPRDDTPPPVPPNQLEATSSQGLTPPPEPSDPRFAAAALGVTVAVLVAALYARVIHARVLAHPKRRKIYEIIAASPGIGISALVPRADVARNAVEHHIRHLKRHGFIVVRKVGAGHFCFTPESCPTNEALVVEAALRDETRRRVARTLLHGPATQKAIGEQTALAQRLVAYHLACLGKAGLATVIDGFPKRYTASKRLLLALPTAPSSTDTAS